MEASFFEVINGESSRAYAARVFDRLFGHNIAVALGNEDAWKDRRRPSPLFLGDIFSSDELQQEAGAEHMPHKDAGLLSAMAHIGLKNPQEIWSVKTNAKIFLKAVLLFLEKRKEDVGKLTFDKDDQLAVEFVTAAANLRAQSFGIPMQSLFDAKGMAGNIVHAIATTNAIISGLIVLESIKLLNKEVGTCRMTYCLEHPSKKLLLMPVEPFERNPSCYVCSQTPLVLEVNTLTTSLREVVDKIVVRRLGASSPIIMQGSNVIYETGADLEEDMIAVFEKNLDKGLASFPVPIANGAVITVEDLQQEFRCTIHVKHRDTFPEEEVDGMVLAGLVAPDAATKADNGFHVSSQHESCHTDDTLLVAAADSIGLKRKAEISDRDDLQKKLKT